ncbi:mutT (Mutator protein) [Clostridium sp. CAG:389]|jgi:8-oxo-dGTP diphosphatase|nr:mutT (Mutator protein) [Clostridium sp. CAG:470]CDE90589.1 mutT (Mutator protein) [Clostridium sp. CAG:389]
MKVIVGGIIEKEGKYLLVQEAKKKCYEKWNFPAGHLDFNESLEQGAIREIKEETGCDVKLDGVCYVANRILEDDLFVMIVFNAKLINENIEFDKEEILDVKWFDYDEIVNKMESMLRGNYVRTAVINQNNNLVAPIDIVDILKD